MRNMLMAVLLAGLAFSACETTSKPLIDRSEAKATSEAPVSAQVEKLTIARDASRPTYVVAVEPFEYSASGQVSGGGQGVPAGAYQLDGNAVLSASEDKSQVRMTWGSEIGPAIGKGIAAQLMSAFSGWGNIAIVEMDVVRRNAEGGYTCKLQPGEIGPFVIKGTVTEFAETADASGKQKGVDTRGLGLATGIIGLLAGNRDLAAGGGAVAILGPQFRDAKMKRTGMVGMDLRIIDGRVARIVPGGSFSCQGSFTTLSAASGVGFLGISSAQGESAASSLGNATRAAMNDALQKTHDTLINVH